MISGTSHCMRIVGGHGGDRWKVCANAKGSESWLLLRFLRRSKIEQLFTCTATNFLSLPLPSTLRASSHFSFRNWSNVLNAELQELANRILPICEHYMVVSQFVESRSHFKHGLTNHAFASGLRAILQVKMSLSYIGGDSWQLFPFVCDVWSRLPQFEHDEAHRMSWLLCRQDYHAMVAQLEHQFRLQRLSLPGLWFFVQVTYLSASSQANNKTRYFDDILSWLRIFYQIMLMTCTFTSICIQPMIGAMQCLSTVLQTALMQNASGAALLNLLHNQVILKRIQ